MNKLKIYFAILLLGLVNICFGQSKELTRQEPAVENRMIRMAEIEIHPEFLEEYKAILKEESEASVRLESGVIAIFPMYQKENPNQFRILEIYADTTAYQSHLQTPHFKHYKEATLKMVKSLKLVDMQALDEATTDLIFRKTGQ